MQRGARGGQATRGRGRGYGRGRGRGRFAGQKVIKNKFLDKLFTNLTNRYCNPPTITNYENNLTIKRNHGGDGANQSTKRPRLQTPAIADGNIRDYTSEYENFKQCEVDLATADHWGYLYLNVGVTLETIQRKWGARGIGSENYEYAMVYYDENGSRFEVNEGAEDTYEYLKQNKCHYEFKFNNSLKYLLAITFT